MIVTQNADSLIHVCNYCASMVTSYFLYHSCICKNHLYLQADTTDAECRQASGGANQEFVDFLEGPEARQRAYSIASVITSTMEGR